MIFNRTYLFIAFSTIALLVVLSIQVNWMFEAARVKEQLFNERANLVLSKTADALLEYSIPIENIKNDPLVLFKVDSLFRHYMQVYNIQLDYLYEVRPQGLNAHGADVYMASANKSEPRCYEQSLDGVNSKEKVRIKLKFPDDKQFLLAEMGPQSITSVTLIIIVLVLSWRAILQLLKEKKISEHTAEFLNNMTHEFKTPLTNIALAGKMVQRDAAAGGTEKVQHYTGIILEENEKLQHQVEQVLNMAALEKGDIRLHRNHLDFHQLIIDTLRSMQIRMENAGGTIDLNLAAGTHVIEGDKTHLCNSLNNLLDNAIKYSGDAPHIRIETRDDKNNLRLTISDDGIGIHESYHKKVFDKFFRVPTGDVHNVKGFGLGLSYVKKIIELHAGTIEMFSENKKGSTFIITLPHV
jgi:two-component system, OmpR family, phosphate regulon sensor histidine kinase PhoR